MKAPSAPWQTVTLPVCLKYEELFQQFSSILDSLKLSDQQAQQNRGVSIQTMVFQWRVGMLRWKVGNARAALKSHSEECSACQKRWEAVYSVTQWIAGQQCGASAALAMRRGA